jgi:hypothetical protein
MALPIAFTETANLSQLGINPASIGFNTCVRLLRMAVKDAQLTAMPDIRIRPLRLCSRKARRQRQAASNNSQPQEKQ